MVSLTWAVSEGLEMNKALRGRQRAPSREERDFWDRFISLAYDDPEDRHNEIIGILRGVAQDYFRKREDYECRAESSSRKLQKITFSKDQLALIKAAFWQEFKGAGELWFPYDCPEEETVVTTHWCEFLEAVEELNE